MERVEKIRLHPVYRCEYDRLQRMEQGRQYCGHDMSHFLDVARVMWIRNLEERLGLNREVVYAAALLHDIGKGLQYECGTPHHEASAEFARQILPQCGFSETETDGITDAILHHRVKETAGQPLAQLLYQADKLTRRCFSCAASDGCNWPEEKRNSKITL